MRKPLVLWDLSEVENYFKGELPKTIILSSCEVIVDVKRFIETHIKTVQAHNGNEVYYPYFQRLLKVKEILISKNSK